MREATGIRSELHYDAEIRRDNDDCLYQVGITWPSGETEWGAPHKHYEFATVRGYALAQEPDREEATAEHIRHLEAAHVWPTVDYPIKFVWRRVWHTYGTERGIA